jgi:hypothetical protein
MIIEIPFQIPYSVITSQSHIKSIVQADIIIIADKITEKFVVSTIGCHAKLFIRIIIPYD